MLRSPSVPIVLWDYLLRDAIKAAQTLGLKIRTCAYNYHMKLKLGWTQVKFLQTVLYHFYFLNSFDL